MGDLVDLAEKCTQVGILDLPDEVLIKIILPLTARERVPLINSCQRLIVRRRCNSTLHNEIQDDSPNLDSSFKMLVENTPNLRHFTLNPDGSYVRDNWDSGALRLISGWQNLETLHMRDVPCEDYQFLIDIGKQCKNLQKLSLRDVSSSKADSDKVILLQMLEHCDNLRDLTINCSDIDQAEIFSSLAKNVKLERVVTINLATLHSVAPWESSLKNMILQCGKLTTIICYTLFNTKDDFNKAVSAVERIRGDCRRPDFQIQVACYKTRTPLVVGSVFEDFSQNEPFSVDFTRF